MRMWEGFILLSLLLCLFLRCFLQLFAQAPRDSASSKMRPTPNRYQYHRAPAAWNQHRVPALRVAEPLLDYLPLKISVVGSMSLVLQDSQHGFSLDCLS
ncbi:hypothetical protein QBC41DRAFT_150236 [Cercophora samala]|uniref:Secreted protein n=1 Tax=Cercophora samala TaxID=330535 RepID=A0AA40DAB3_9PEZI|nr:hypothetical protein QBC41DRAFT_150236 [Cercophora samala]